MMSALRMIELLALTVQYLDTIGSLARRAAAAGHADMLAALEVIGKIVDALRSGYEGKLDAASVSAELTRLSAQLAKNDAAADAALRARFPDS